MISTKRTELALESIQQFYQQSIKLITVFLSLYYVTNDTYNIQFDKDQSRSFDVVNVNPYSRANKVLTINIIMNVFQPTTYINVWLKDCLVIFTYFRQWERGHTVSFITKISLEI